MDVMLTLALITSCMVAVTALHLRLTAPPREPLLLRPADDVDAEFFRIIGCEGLRDIASDAGCES
jgi:hypothetical protein